MHFLGSLVFYNIVHALTMFIIQGIIVCTIGLEGLLYTCMHRMA